MADKKSKPNLKNDNKAAGGATEISELREEIGRLHDEMRQEIRLMAERQITKAHRRRRWSNFFHDLVIIVLTVVAVYFGYCLYDAHYFSFLKTACEKDGTCKVAQGETDGAGGAGEGGGTGSAGESADDSGGAGGSSGTAGSGAGNTTTAGPVKDDAWYLANYRYLYDRLDLRADADNVAAYYLYSGDFAALELKAETRLAMAYNQLENRNLLNVEPAVASVDIPESALFDAYKTTFGTSEGFVQESFTNGCLEFTYNKISLNFTAQNTTCTRNTRREIVEEVERIFADGEVIYVVTVAGVLDKDSQVLYNFDNLFRPVAAGLGSAKVVAENLQNYQAVLNRYQYKFTKNGNDYKFVGITKLQ